ncbi:MAG: leucine-rich repeat domain-containing protein [Aureispira sp.]
MTYLSNRLFQFLLIITISHLACDSPNKATPTEEHSWSNSTIYGNIEKALQEREKVQVIETIKPMLLDSLIAFPNLKSLRLSYYKEDTVFRALPALPELQHLSISLDTRDRLTNLSVLNAVSKMTKLQSLNLHLSDLVLAEEEHFQLLQQLQELDLGVVNAPLPASIYTLTTLKRLVLAGNVNSLSTDLGNLTNLETLYISGNGGLKEFPASIGQLSKLKAIYAASESISFLPASFEKLQNLKTLYLVGNPISEEQITAIRTALPNCTVEY